MKEKAPLANPFIGETRGGRAVSPCGHCPKGVVVELKR
jgi:hypothetical protein